MTRQRYLELPEDFKPSPTWHYGGLEVLVDCTLYTAALERDWRWCEFLKLAPGDESLFPVKAMVPNRGIGQWKLEEVKRWRYERTILEALEELHRKNGTDLPPGVDADWLTQALNEGGS